MEEETGKREVLVVEVVVGEARTVGWNAGVLALVNTGNIGQNITYIITVPCGTVGVAGREIS